MFWSVLVWLISFAPLINHFLPDRILGLQPINLLIIALLLFLLYIGIFTRFSHYPVKLLFLLLLIVCDITLRGKLYGATGSMLDWIKASQNLFLLLIFVMSAELFPPRRRDLEIGLSVAVIFVFLIGCYSFVTNNYFGLTSELVIRIYALTGTHARAMFIYSNPNVAAYYFLGAFILLTYFWDVRAMLKISYRSLTLWMCVFAVFMTFSKTGIALLLLILAYKLICLTPQKKLLLLFGVPLCAVLSPVVYRTLAQNFWVFQSEYIVSNARWLKWQVGLNQLGQYWLLGQSPVKVSHGILLNTNVFSDNQFISTLLDFGLVGVLLILLVAVLSVRLYRQAKRLGNLPLRMLVWETSAAILIGCFFNGLVDFFPANLVIALSLLFAVSEIKSVALSARAAETPPSPASSPAPTLFTGGKL